MTGYNNILGLSLILRAGWPWIVCVEVEVRPDILSRRGSKTERETLEWLAERSLVI